MIEPKGCVNAQVVEKWTREPSVKPDRVFVTGSSAGAYGALMNSLPMQEFVYPSTDFSVLADAGNVVITDDFLENDIRGIEKNLPEWIPGPGWVNAECDECGVVLPGDPTPTPVEPPFTEDGRGVYE